MSEGSRYDGINELKGKQRDCGIVAGEVWGRGGDGVTGWQHPPFSFDFFFFFFYMNSISGGQSLKPRV